jgi:hypothetical protein
MKQINLNDIFNYIKKLGLDYIIGKFYEKGKHITFTNIDMSNYIKINYKDNCSGEVEGLNIKKQEFKNEDELYMILNPDFLEESEKNNKQVFYNTKDKRLEFIDKNNEFDY